MTVIASQIRSRAALVNSKSRLRQTRTSRELETLSLSLSLSPYIPLSLLSFSLSLCISWSPLSTGTEFVWPIGSSSTSQDQLIQVITGIGSQLTYLKSPCLMNQSETGLSHHLNSSIYQFINCSKHTISIHDRRLTDSRPGFLVNNSPCKFKW